MDGRALVDREVHDPDSALGLDLAALALAVRQVCFRQEQVKRLPQDVPRDARRNVAVATSVTRRPKKAR